MYLATRENMVPGRTLRERLENLERIGYGGIELIGSVTELSVEEIRQAFLGSSIRPCIIPAAPGRDLVALERATRREALEATLRRIEIAAEIGAPGLLLALYQPPQYPDLSPAFTAHELQRRVFVAQLHELAPAAERAGVQLVLEPLNRYETSFLRSLSDGLRLCQEIGSPALRIMADFFHMQLEEAQVPESIRAAAAYLVHVHVADSNREQPGRGHLDFRPGFRTLKEIGYDGPLSLECRLAGEPLEVLRSAGDYLKRQWDEA
jgi:sugar phosphate isomerase/epimerase